MDKPKFMKKRFYPSAKKSSLASMVIKTLEHLQFLDALQISTFPF